MRPSSRATAQNQPWQKPPSTGFDCMSDWQNARIADSATIQDAIVAIDRGGLQIALVTDEDGRLLGVVSDGDVRRGILRGVSLEEPVAHVMNVSPTTAREHDDRETLLAIMRQKRLHQLPILDGGWRVTDVVLVDDLLSPGPRENPVILMAGGMGTRLQPLTDECPKPLLKVGNKPILQTILESFIEYGFRRFWISVNYKAEMIRDHFGAGENWGVTIEYVQEKQRLGTAGALSLLPERPQLPIVVMNGDLLTRVNFGHLLDFHTAHHVSATMSVREYALQIPYGVVETEGHRMVALSEKPVHRYLVNAGIYVLQPDALSFVPDGRQYNMTDLFRDLRAAGRETAAFPIREYWMDVGQLDDFHKANGEFGEIFG